MRIAFLTFQLKNGGAERMVARLSNAFVKRGHQVDILLFDVTNPDYAVDPSVRIIDVGSKGISKLTKIPKKIWLIHNYIRDNKPDIIVPFIIYMIPFVPLARIGTSKNVKIIGAERTNPRYHNKIIRSFINLFLPFCDGFVFQTEGAKSCYPKYIQKRSIVIGNIAPVVKQNRITENVILNAVCSVGRLHNDKDYETLIKGFALVVDKIPNATLHIYGSGPLKECLERLSKKLGIHTHVVFEGFSRDIASELVKYKVFAFSSKNEGMPNALMEAMCCGCACISSDCDFGPRELIIDGENGFLVPVENYHVLAARIVQLLQDQELTERLGRNARKIQNDYSEERIASAYLNYAEKLIK